MFPDREAKQGFVGIDIPRPLCGIQRDINRPQTGPGGSPAQPILLKKQVSEQTAKQSAQLVDISKLGLNSKIKKFSYSFICGKGYSPPSRENSFLSTF